MIMDEQQHSLEIFCSMLGLHLVRYTNELGSYVFVNTSDDSSGQTIWGRDRCASVQRGMDSIWFDIKTAYLKTCGFEWTAQNG